MDYVRYVRYYSHDYNNDTCLTFNRNGSRSELSLTFDSEDPDMGTEELIYAGDNAESVFEMVPELHDEITAYLDSVECYDRSSYVDKYYSEYSRTALYAFEGILENVMKEWRK